MYQVGFLNGTFSDVLLHVPSLTADRAYKLHSLILCRSPTLLHVLNSAADYHDISLSIEDPNITEESFAIALGHLYASYSHQAINPLNAKNVLATAYFLELPDLANLAFQIMVSNLSLDNVLDYTRFVEGISGNPADNSNGHATNGSGETTPTNGSHSPQLSQASTTKQEYGIFGQQIRDACFHFLTTGLTSGEPVFGSHKNENARRLLVSTLVQLPFEWLKKVVESDKFSAPSDVERYHLAKEVIHLREKARNPALGGEESVVMVFGSTSASAISIVRKPLRPLGGRRTERVLWRAPMNSN